MRGAADSVLFEEHVVWAVATIDDIVPLGDRC